MDKYYSTKAYLILCYALLALGVLTTSFLPLIVAFFAIYLPKDRCESFALSHIEYILNTFWLGLCFVIASILVYAVLLLLVAILPFLSFMLITWSIFQCLLVIWFIYRTIKGFVCLMQDKTI